MTSSVDTHAWVAGWLDDFRACRSGAHGAAWRARAEQELRTAGPAQVSDHARASTWARIRLEFLGSDVA